MKIKLREQISINHMLIGMIIERGSKKHTKKDLALKVPDWMDIIRANPIP